MTCSNRQVQRRRNRLKSPRAPMPRSYVRPLWLTSETHRAMGLGLLSPLGSVEVSSNANSKNKRMRESDTTQIPTPSPVDFSIGSSGTPVEASLTAGVGEALALPPWIHGPSRHRRLRGWPARDQAARDNGACSYPGR